MPVRNTWQQCQDYRVMHAYRASIDGMWWIGSQPSMAWLFIVLMQVGQKALRIR